MRSFPEDNVLVYIFWLDGHVPNLMYASASHLINKQQNMKQKVKRMLGGYVNAYMDVKYR